MGLTFYVVKSWEKGRVNAPLSTGHYAGLQRDDRYSGMLCQLI